MVINHAPHIATLFQRASEDNGISTYSDVEEYSECWRAARQQATDMEVGVRTSLQPSTIDSEAVGKVSPSQIQASTALIICSM